MAVGFRVEPELLAGGTEAEVGLARLGPGGLERELVARREVRVCGGDGEQEGEELGVDEMEHFGETRRETSTGPAALNALCLAHRLHFAPPASHDLAIDQLISHLTRSSVVVQ